MTLVDKIIKLSKGHNEGFIQVYRNKEGKLDAQWQYESGSLDIEVLDENYSETMNRIEASIHLDGDKYYDDEVIGLLEDQWGISQEDMI